MNKYTLTTILSVVFLTGSAIAVTQNTTKETKLQQTFSAEIVSKSKVWNISPAAYNQSINLSNKYSGIIAKDITPLEILGAFSKTAQERKKYAKQFVKLMHEAETKVLAFDRLVRKTHFEIYGYQDLIQYKSPKPMKDRNTYSINIQDCDVSCKQKISKLTLSPTPIDLYFLNATNDEINQFAQNLNIPIEDVQSGNITLNHAE